MTTPPSRLVLLKDLPRVQHGVKVRFAGRVTLYDPPTGILTLIPPDPTMSTTQHSDKHNPQEPLQGEFEAQVEISHVLSTAPSRLFEPRALVSVIGYVIPPPLNGDGNDGASGRAYVQALVMWDAAAAMTPSVSADGDGIKDKSSYEEIVLARMRAMKGMEAARARWESGAEE